MNSKSAFVNCIPLSNTIIASHGSTCVRPARPTSVRANHLHAQLGNGEKSQNRQNDGSSQVTCDPTAPWQQVSTPVHSVCTYSSELGRGNMNLLTYMSPCGIGPRPKFAVALYIGTLTWVSAKQKGKIRVSFLTENHAPLFSLFGKRSGRDVDKVAEAREMGFNISCTNDGVPFPSDCIGYVDLSVDQWIDLDDHELAICSTVSHRTLVPSTGINPTALTTGYLRANGYY